MMRFALLCTAILGGLILFAIRAECAFCGTAPCQTNVECFSGCACAIGQDRQFGTCVSIAP